MLSVAAAGAATGAGTMAYFSDTESSTGNSIAAGTLDLTLDGSSQTVTFLDDTGVTPGDQGAGSVTLGNAGSIAGDLEIELTAIRSNENGYYGTENGNADQTPNDGELDEYLDVEATVGTDTVWPRETVQNLSESTVYTPGTTITPGGNADFTLSWWFPDEGNQDDAQSDSVELDLTFRLIQGGP